MTKFTLRTKLLIFSIIVALIPLGIAGWNMITITQDELKSAANEELSSTALQIANEIDNFYLNTWATPMLLIRDAVDDEQLQNNQKLSILSLGVEKVVDIVSIQLVVENIPRPFLIRQRAFAESLGELGIDPVELLSLSWEEVSVLLGNNESFIGDLHYLKAVDAWMLTMIVPLEKEIMGDKSVLAARIDLSRLKKEIESHPFTKTSLITLIQNDGRRIFDPERASLAHLQLVEQAMEHLTSDVKVAGVHHYTRPSGERMLGAYAFPFYLGWGVIVEKSEKTAYLAVSKMTRSLLFWALVGFAAAAIAAIVVSYSLTKPLQRLTRAANKLSSGDFSVSIEGRERKDEIGALSQAFIKMVADLQHYIHELTETTKLKERAESELRFGRDIQQSFIPKEFRETNEFEFWGMCEPAREVGGDFLDYIVFDEYRYGFVIGDVSGKGVPAALFVSMCRILFRMLSSDLKAPDVVMEQFNDKILEFDPSCNMFITLFYGIYDIRTGKFLYSTAGHNMPFVRFAGGKSGNGGFEMLPPIQKTMVAGMIDGIEFESAEIQLSPGDMLFMYTDGMTEAMNHQEEQFGEERLCSLLEDKRDLPAKKICQEVVKEVIDYQENQPQFDDMTVMMLKVRELAK